MAGMTIWCEADWNDFIMACGATPVNTPFSEVYSSLQKNMYDGLMIAAETLQSCNFAEVCKYITMIDFCYMSGPGHLMNMNTWNSLPEDLQAIITDPELAGVRFYAFFTNNESLLKILGTLNTDKSMSIRERNDVIYISRKK